MPTATTTPSSRWMTLAWFLLLVIGGGMAIGYATRPDAWYAALAKPSFNPPNWVFGPVWTILYVLIAIAGGRTWQRLPRTATAMSLWALQMALNFAWSPAFFALHRVDIAFVIVLAMLAAIGAFIVVSMRHDRLSALLFAPYFVWVAFATTLNGAIWRLN